MTMNNAKKMRGFGQEIYRESATAKELVGSIRDIGHGLKYRYSQAGSSALSAGKLVMGPRCNASLVNQTITAAVAVGTRVLTLTVTAPGTAIAENYFAGGMLQINDEAGEGIQYPVESSSALAAAGTSITITMQAGIVTALTTSSQFSLVPSPWRTVATSTTEENFPAGVPPIPVTAGYYFWAQTGGLACVLYSGTPAVGSMLVPSATAGAVTAASSTFDNDQPVVGIAYGTVGVSGEYKPAFLTID